MTPVVAIVEGDGEVVAVPILLRRLNNWLSPGLDIEVPHPIRVRRDRFVNRDDEFRRMLLLAAAKCGEHGWILVLLDADDDCPAHLGVALLARVREVVPALARLRSAGGARVRGMVHRRCCIARRPARLPLRCLGPRQPEELRNAKGWIADRMDGYRETTDQPAFAAAFDLVAAQLASRSFRKLCDEWSRQSAPADSPP